MSIDEKAFKAAYNSYFDYKITKETGQRLRGFIEAYETAKSAEQLMPSKDMEGVQFDAGSSPQRAADNSDNVTPSSKQPMLDSQIKSGKTSDMNQASEQLVDCREALPQRYGCILKGSKSIPLEINRGYNMRLVGSVYETQDGIREEIPMTDKITDAKYKAGYDAGCAETGAECTKAALESINKRESVKLVDCDIAACNCGGKHRRSE